jgi:hypothetical protein
MYFLYSVLITNMFTMVPGAAVLCRTEQRASIRQGSKHVIEGW